MSTDAPLDVSSDSSFFSPTFSIFTFLILLFVAIGAYVVYAGQELAKAGIGQNPKKVLSKKKAAKLAKKNRFSIGD